jgi:hypothetical protein
MYWRLVEGNLISVLSIHEFLQEQLKGKRRLVDKIVRATVISHHTIAPGCSCPGVGM